MIKKLLFALTLLLSTVLVRAQQDKAEMEKERQEVQKEIRELQSVYSKIKGQKNVTLGQANLIKRKIALQEKYLNNINRELRTINDDIYLSTLEINKLAKQVDTLKTQYARTVVYAYKNRSTYDYLNFIFSAASFNDAIKRVAYLKSYRTYREKQVSTILETQKLIEERKQENLARRQQKSSTLQEQAKEIKVLADQKKEKDVVVAQLKSKEKELQKQINDKRKKDNKLKSAIASIIRREIDAASAEERKRRAAEPKTTTTSTTTTGSTTKPDAKKTAPAKSVLELNAKDVALGKNFESSRGRLPWPVDQGYVSLHYGTNRIEGLTFDNPGITIITPSQGATVKSVFDGEVVGVYNLGDGMAITIRHGKYFSTYSNLSSVNVSKGTEVRTGQALGKAGQAEEGSGGQIDFILMIEKKQTNPEPWLRK